MILKARIGTSKKRLNVFPGIFIYLLLISEFFIGLCQPVFNLGFNFELYEPYFYVNKVVKDSPAEISGIEKNQFYVSINGITYNEFVDIRKSMSEDAFKKQFSTFFKFNERIALVDNHGTEYSFILKPIPLLQKIRTANFFYNFKFFIGMLMILTGIFILLFLNADKTITSLVYTMYFIGITTANLFDSYFLSPEYLILSTIFLDFGLLSTFTGVFVYFSEIFSYANYRDIFKYLKYLPPAMFILKYIHIIIFKWNISENPFYKLNSYLVITCCIIFLVVFIFVTFSFPKSLTTTFKFFIIGLAFAITPLMVDHFGYVLSNSIFMTESDKIYSTVAFIFVPFMLLLAILHSKNMIRSKAVSWITTFLAFSIITGPIFITFLDYIPLFSSKNFTLFYVLCSPLIFYFIQYVMNKFFSLNTRENEKILSNYKQIIAPITDTLQLHEVTTREINKILDCSYAFFYKKNDTGIWDLLYSWGPIDNETRVQKLNESYTKKRVTFYKDGCFSLPILRNNKTTGVIYIGPKSNGDQYLPGEHIVIEQIIQTFHSHWLTYTNNRLVQELQIKNQKLVYMQERTILSMANLIESRDGGTGAHVKRTAEYSVLIARRALEKGIYKDEITDYFIDLLYKAAPMHDIGKIIVPDNVLKKPGKLTPEEFALMKLHTTEGERIVKEVLSTSEDEAYIKMTSDIAMYHHEKWNGTGYPYGLKENDIPLCARILAIADVFDALVSPRCYKEPMEPEKAFAIIKADAGIHFDPILAEVFLELKEDALEIMGHEFL